MSANFWFAAAKVVNYFELRKKKIAEKAIFCFHSSVFTTHLPKSRTAIRHATHGDSSRK